MGSVSGANASTSKKGTGTGIVTEVTGSSLKILKTSGAFAPGGKIVVDDQDPDRTTWTYSAWVKPTDPGTSVDSHFLRVDSGVGGQKTELYYLGGKFTFYSDNIINLITDEIFVDPSVWNHVVLAVDTTKIDSTDRVKLYLNGSRVYWNLISSSLYPPQGYLTRVSTTYEHFIGVNADFASSYLEGYLADINFVDGVQVAPEEFASNVDGLWTPKRYHGRYGRYGWHLIGGDAASDGDTSLGADSSGNDTDWTASGFTQGDSAIFPPFKNSLVFDVQRYIGNGAVQDIEVGFSPALIWIKNGDQTSNHMIFDSVRGPAKVIYSSSTSVEQPAAISVTSFNPTGYSISNAAAVNANGQRHMSWCWKAGVSTVTNNDGSISSDVSASSEYGFSVVKWTGAGATTSKTVGHGLGAAPKFILTKALGLNSNWGVYHAGIGNVYDLALNNDNGKRIYPTWDNTDPTSTVFSIGPTGQTNESGIDYVAYCWSEIPGYSKFGEYEGSNGPLTIETGFTPRWILFKSHNTSGQEWVIKDNVLQPDNLYADRTNVFDSNRTVTFNATGFTISDSQGPMNWPGRSYIYAAFGDDFDPSAIDTFVDSPDTAEADLGNGGEFAANYAKMSTIDKGSGATISKGGLTVSHPGSATWNNGGIRGTIGVSSGQWYWEVTKASDTPFSMYGVATSLADFSESYSTPTHTWTYISNGGNKLGDGVGGAGASYGISYDAGDVIGVALDMDAGTLTFYKNGVSQGVAFSSLAGKTVFLGFTFIATKTSQFELWWSPLRVCSPSRS